MAELPTTELRKAISDILDGANLDDLSSKKIRKQLEQKYGIDFTDRKKEIDGLVMDLISKEKPKKAEAKKAGAKKADPKEENGNVSSSSSAGHSSHDEDNDEACDDDDEVLARKLQDEEFKSRSRAVKKTRPPKKEPAKGAKKAAVKPKGAKRESVYSRKCVLSPELAAVMGEDQMARHDVVKRMWGIFRERELFDPSNKQFGICDSQLLKVFGKKRVQLFGMMKYLKSHIKDIE